MNISPCERIEPKGDIYSVSDQQHAEQKYEIDEINRAVGGRSPCPPVSLKCDCQLVSQLATQSLSQSESARPLAHPPGPPPPPNSLPSS